MPEWLASRVATVACFLPLLVYFALFAFRRETSLRPITTTVLMALGVVVRLALWGIGVEMGVTGFLFCIVFAVMVAMHVFGYRPVHVHTSEALLRAEIDEACRRLFIQKEESRRGELCLSAKGVKATLSLASQGKSFVMMFLPNRIESGKLTLFFDWLAKRYPGPVPRIRVDLSRRT